MPTTHAVQIVSQLWKLIPDIECPLASRPLVHAVMRLCSFVSVTMPEVRPAAFFALANFSGISCDARNALIELGVLSHVDLYLSSYTCSEHVRSGLRLASNLLAYGVADVAAIVDNLTSVLRCHLLHQYDRNRQCSARCITLLLSDPIGLERCIDFEVPAKLCECIAKDDVYLGEVFGAVCAFLRHGEDEHFVEPEFLDVLVDILDQNLDLPMLELFQLLSYLVVKVPINFWKLHCIPCLFKQLSDGCFENQAAAALLMFSILTHFGIEIAKEIATEDFCGAVLGILASMDDDEQKIVVTGIAELIRYEDPELLEIWQNVELVNLIESLAMEHGSLHEFLPLITPAGYHYGEEI
jgi:hypothetical protein